MKQEFDKWYDEDRKKAKPFSTINLRTIAYSAWKASREILEIETPNISPYANSMSDKVIGYSLAIDDFKKAIHAAGVKTK